MRTMWSLLGIRWGWGSTFVGERTFTWDNSWCSHLHPMKVAWEWSMKVVSSWKACASNTFIHVGCIVWRQFPTNFKKIGVFLQNTPLYSAGCGGCWFTVRERYSWLACGQCWFGVREKHCCWLPAEQSGRRSEHQYTVSFWWGAW